MWFKKKKKESDFIYDGGQTHYQTAMLNLRGEIKALKKYLPSEQVSELELMIAGMLKWTCEQARSNGVDIINEKYNIFHRFNTHSYNSDVYNYPNAIYEKK